jgi:hypothetical protein
MHLSAEGHMPIIAYMGIPYDKTTEENFKIFSECGFNVSLYIYPSLEQMKKACYIADKYGIKILGHCNETHNNPEKAAAIMRDVPGFFGYVLQDEPSADEIKKRQYEIELLKKADNTHYFYLNLHPYYTDWILKYTKTKTYQEYLEAASVTSCQQISFDYYPITKKGIRDGWYNNIEMVRQQSLKIHKPFWGFVLSVPHADYPQPTIESLRLQVYSNLAYGAQAIQYFTYWTPPAERINDYHNGPIDQNGNKTKTYYLVQQMNQELKVIAKLFYGAKVLSVHHLGGELPKGTTRLTRMPINLSSLKVVSSKGAIISQLEKNGHRYLAIVNKNHEDTIKVLIKPLNDTPRHLTKVLKEEPMKDCYSISAGDILLFRLK